MQQLAFQFPLCAIRIFRSTFGIDKDPQKLHQLNLYVQQQLQTRKRIGRSNAKTESAGTHSIFVCYVIPYFNVHVF